MTLTGRRTSTFVLAALSAGAALVALALPGSATAPGTTTVWQPTPVCAAPAPGHMSCFAQKLVKRVVPSANTGTGGVRAATSVRPSLTDGPNGGYTPAELARAYGVNASGATTQTVAIVDAFHDPSALTDLNHFDSAYGLPHETATSFKVVFDTPTQAAPPSDEGWALEITLDVQAVRGLCHKCKILLVEARSDSDSDIGHAVAVAANHAKIISNSYGTPETDPDATAAVAANYNKPGVAMLAASGDDGWYGWDFWNCASATCGGANQETDSAPSVPASLNTVIGVGGTSLHLTPTGTRAAEEVWNDNGPADVYGLNLGLPLGAAGSGCSASVAASRWQSHVSRYSTLGCGTRRSSVDIAADADPFTGFDVWQTFGNESSACTSQSFCWETIGGTSLSSPLVAAMWGLAGGPGNVRFPALSLYGHFRATRGSTYDVTVGGTGLCDFVSPVGCTGGVSPNGVGQTLDCAWGVSGASDQVLANRYQCYAQPGFDGVSGVGTPRGVTVFKAMTPRAVIKSPGTVTHNVTHTFSAAGTTDPFPGGGIKTYAWNWGDGHSTSTSSVTTSHKYAAKATRTITLTVTDVYGIRGTRKITISVK